MECPLQTKVKDLDFIKSTMGIHWKVLRKDEARYDLHFKI